MAHFAELDENNVVLRIIVVSNDECRDDSGNESEAIGASFCNRLLGGVWKQTSYNGRIRKNYAGIGFIYDEAKDAFIEPQPFPSWALNTTTCQWEPPSPFPLDGGAYIWDEPTLSWVSVESVSQP
ncbi:hypothetical protein UFOVP120_80 [uncultured Caudovirales phage]|uniref:Uncharacterized protein n=1 Tax=uncultured Caudovirales phage TaxID=2100421 RepID=A0A6J5LEJ9_9CAUD|nr:hypothetical protein UFOVP120_80 [uncultured Caudovirales phage]